MINQPEKRAICKMDKEDVKENRNIGIKNRFGRFFPADAQKLARVGQRL